MGKMLMPKLGVAPKMPMEKMMEQMAKAKITELDYRAKISKEPIENAFGEKSSSHNSSNVKVVPPPFVPYAIDILSNVKEQLKALFILTFHFVRPAAHSACFISLLTRKKSQSAIQML